MHGMGSKVIFEDYTIQCINAMDDRINAALEECGGEMVSAVKRNSRVDTGRTKNSFQYKVDDSTHTVYIGSNADNAVGEEFGTGEHALAGNGRKGGWVYKDAKGKWHFTRGKKPSRAFWNAYVGLKGAIITHLQDSLRGM